MYSKPRSVILSLAVIGLGLTVGGRGADDGVSQRVGTDGPDGSLAASLMTVLAETAGSATAYAQGRRNCETARRGTRSRRCVQRRPWNFENGGDTYSGPMLTPDGRFVVFASRENLDENDNDIDPSMSTGFDFDASSDIFRFTIQNGALRRVSVDEAGNLPRPVASELPDSVSPAISASGRLVAFATDGILLPEDRNTSGDVYLKNLRTREVSLVSTETGGGSQRLAAGGVPVVTVDNNAVSVPSVAMSDNARFVAFITSVRLDPDRDRNDFLDVYLKNLRNNEYSLVSLASNGTAGGVTNRLPGDDPFGDIANLDVEISANGRFVAFVSQVDLDSTEDDDRRDVFIWDRFFPDTAPILASPGTASDIFSIALSANGRFVAFDSEDALVPGDLNGLSDIYRYDRAKRELVRVSLDAEGRETALGGSIDPALSADGRFAAFSSAAGDLVLNDTSFGFDIQGFQFLDLFVKDLRTGAITRASVDDDGVETEGRSFAPSLSADGTVVAFITDDSNLLEAQPENQRPGETVVVTQVNFAPLPFGDIPGAPPGAVSIGQNFEFQPLEFALRNTVDRPGDQDWFRVALTAGTTYVIDLEGRPSRQGTLDDPLLRILVPKIPGVDLDLEALDDDCGQGLNARLAFEPRESGTYFISAEGFGAARGTYRLLVREAPDPGCTP